MQKTGVSSKGTGATTFKSNHEQNNGVKNMVIAKSGSGVIIKDHAVSEPMHVTSGISLPHQTRPPDSSLNRVALNDTIATHNMNRSESENYLIIQSPQMSGALAMIWILWRKLQE